MPAGPAGRGRAEPELSDHSLHRVHGIEPGALEHPLLADPVEQAGSHVLQIRAAVCQYQLRDVQRQQRVSAGNRGATLKIAVAEATSRSVSCSSPG
jgi:hypothetical protein